MTLGKLVNEYRKANKMSMQTLGDMTNLSKSYISMLERDLNPATGRKIKPSLDTLRALAKIMNMEVNELIEKTDDNIFLSKGNKTDPFSFSNISPVTTKKVPMLGTISCGKPIFCSEENNTFIDISNDLNVDFCLKASGDSMTGARINDGDIVFIREQPMVEHGEIAAVIINDEAVLKRVYYYKEKEMIILRPENSNYEDIIYSGEELNNIKILGKAVAFQSILK